MRTLSLLPALALLLGLSLSPGEAAAQSATDVRFRGGVGLDGGAFIVPGSFTLGSFGIQGQLGFQVGDLGVYVVPNAAGVFGSVGGFTVGAAMMVDYTFGDRFSIGAGPDLSLFQIFGGDYNDTVGPGGLLAGARVSLRFYPVLVHGESNPQRRHALSLGLDLRALGGPGLGPPEGREGFVSPGEKFVFWPAFNISYQAF